MKSNIVKAAMVVGIIVIVFVALTHPSPQPTGSGKKTGGVPQTTPTLEGMKKIIDTTFANNGNKSNAIWVNMPSNVTEAFLVLFTNNTSGKVYVIDPNNHIMLNVNDQSGKNYSTGYAVFSDPPSVVLSPGKWVLRYNFIGSGNVHIILAIKT